MYNDIQIERNIYASEEHQMLKEALDEFFNKEASPYYHEWEKEKRVPREFWQKMGEHGFLCMDVSEEYGGAGLDFNFSAIMRNNDRFYLLFI